MGDKLIVFLNAYDFLIRKKGKPFMKYEDRAEMILRFKCVDEVVVVVIVIIGGAI